MSSLKMHESSDGYGYEKSIPQRHVIGAEDYDEQSALEGSGLFSLDLLLRRALGISWSIAIGLALAVAFRHLPAETESPIVLAVVGLTGAGFLSFGMLALRDRTAPDRRRRWN